MTSSAVQSPLPPMASATFPRLSSPIPRSPSFFFTATPPTEIYTLSLHDALPIFCLRSVGQHMPLAPGEVVVVLDVEERSEEHTSELQSRGHLVCRLLLEKKKKIKHTEKVL